MDFLKIEKIQLVFVNKHGFTCPKGGYHILDTAIHYSSRSRWETLIDLSTGEGVRVQVSPDLVSKEGYYCVKCDKSILESEI